MKNRKRLLAVLLAAIMMITLNVFNAAPAMAQYMDNFSGQYTIKNVETGLMLNVFATSSTIQSKSPVKVCSNDGSAEQRFTIVSAGNQKVRLMSYLNTKYCIDIYGNANAITSGAKVQVWAPSDSGTNLWYLDYIPGDNNYVIRSGIKDKANLALTAAGTITRSDVVVKNYSASDKKQRWIISPAPAAPVSGTSGPANWKLPWKSSKQAKFVGGYGKSDSGAWSSHFTTRYGSSFNHNLSLKRSLALDFASTESNFEILAPTSGTVTRGSDPSGYGNYVVLKTDDGYEVWFGHLKSISISNGRINAGTPIGMMGSTGNSSGQHLHIDIRNALPNIASGSDYTPITNLFGKSVRTWAYSSNAWYSGGF
ncbi:MAG: peptidoglycan DD-metalloendopeptidase family protein [Peptococcaceae bacterium]|nr:peptidoglycan DD-metalloendopeptidase family protein [Peptococcaceae bacterium]